MTGKTIPKNQKGYTSVTKLDRNAWITSPDVPCPDNLPEPLGWTLLVRPYPVTVNESKVDFMLSDNEIDFMSYVTNIGRVVSMGPCCWSRPEHMNRDGERFEWVKEGDFVTFPKNAGGKRKFQGVSYILLCDDEINERLPDPQIFDNDYYKVDIPKEHLEKYNTIYKKE